MFYKATVLALLGCVAYGVFVTIPQEFERLENLIYRRT